MSLLLSGPRLIHWDCQALCLGPRLGLKEDADVVLVVDEGNPVEGLPPLAISLMRSKGFRDSLLAFEPPPIPANDPSPEAPDKFPLAEREGIDAVEELNELLNIDSVPELVRPANPARPNLDNASGETFDPASNG